MGPMKIEGDRSRKWGNAIVVKLEIGITYALFIFTTSRTFRTWGENPLSLDV